MVTALSADEPHDVVWRHEASWLARLWRLAPLTLLVHDSGARAGRLVGEGILPLTARRGIDQALAAGGPPVPVPVASPAAALRRVPERVLRFDAAVAADPDAGLREALFALLPEPARQGRRPAARLVDAAQHVHAAGGARLLLVVENLDQLLLPRDDNPAPRQALCDGLVDLLQADDMPVHMLLVVDERADALLDGLRRRLPYIDDHRLRLGGRRDALRAAARPLAAAQPAADFQRSLDAMLLRVTLAVEPPVQAAARNVDPTPAPSAEPPMIELPAEPAAPAAQQAPRRRAPALLTAAAALAGAVVLGWAGFVLTQGTQTVAAAAPPAAAPLPLVAAAPAAAPAPAPAAELAQALRAAGIPLALAAGDAAWAELLRGLDRQPGLALVRYDALQVAAAGARRPQLQVLAPLFSDALYFVVRDGAAPRALHEMGSLRINVGPAAGARALTIGTLWSALFGAPLPAAQADRLPVAQALQQLRAGSLDVVAWVGTPPPELLSGAGTGLRLLRVDRAHPSSLRLQQRFLPATLAAGGDAVPGLAVMNFLVAGAASSGSELRRAARALCTALPELRRSGRPPWSGVRADLALPVDWPYAAAAADVGRCETQGTPGREAVLTALDAATVTFPNRPTRSPR